MHAPVLTLDSLNILVCEYSILISYTNKLLKLNFISNTKIAECSGISKLLYKTVKVLGCASYVKAIEETCECVWIYENTFWKWIFYYSN